MTDRIDVDGIIAPVLQLKPGQAAVKRDNPRFCAHNQYLVDEQTLEVTCGSCNRPLVAGQVLLDYARREREWQWHTQQVRDAEKRVAELKEEERRVKARLRCALRKDADQAVQEERRRTTRMRGEIVLRAREIADLAKRVESLATRKDEP